MGTIRRVQNEIRRDWTNDYQESSSIYHLESHIDNPQINISFIIFFTGNYNPLHINIDFKDRIYPFKPPNVFVGKNKKDYISCLPTSWTFANMLLGNKCACCNSILCHWPGPGSSMKDIMEEVKENFILKIRMMEIAHCKKIVDKIFGHYLPIEEFL